MRDVKYFILGNDDYDILCLILDQEVVQKIYPNMSATDITNTRNLMKELLYNYLISDI